MPIIVTPVQVPGIKGLVKICLTHQATCFKMDSWQANLRHFKKQSSTFRTLTTALLTL
jgi:hypothetical protein